MLWIGVVASSLLGSVKKTTFAGMVNDNAMMNISYELRLAADGALIQAPSDPLAAMMAAWQTQFDLQLARNMPLVLLTNTSQRTDVEITHFTMTVGKPALHFKFANVVEASTGVEATINVTTPGEDMAGGEVVDLELANLTQDAFVLFQIGLAPDAEDAFQLSDFRAVLFDANGGDMRDNSVAAASFAATGDGNAMAPSNAMTLSGPIEDFEVHDPVFVGPAFHSYETMDPVNVFTHRDEGFLSADQPVPEPSTLVELLLSVAGLVALGCRSPVPGKKKYNDSLPSSIG